MADNNRVSQMLDEKQAPAPPMDPFSQARQVFQNQQGGQQPQQLMSPGLDYQQAIPGQAQGPVQQSIGKSLFQPGGPTQQPDFASSKLPQAMQKLGLDGSGIAFNQLGRIQLMGRLQKRFGANLQSSPEAMDLLSQFDEHVKNQDSKSMDTMNANGKRTLAAIFGG